jgi:nicotinate-nucleotide adenylyltransferase
MRVALLGGSFDPLHFGHLFMGAELLWRCEPDALWLLPVARHAFDKPLSSFDDRLEMARIGARLLGSMAPARPVEALPVEEELVRKGGDGTTVSLLRHLTAQQPAVSFLLGLGADAWAQRAAWRDFDGLAKLAQVVVCNRAGVPEVEGGGPVLPDISSTVVRERVRAQQPIDDLVPAEIARYIRARGLYCQAG